MNAIVDIGLGSLAAGYLLLILPLAILLYQRVPILRETGIAVVPGMMTGVILAGADPMTAIKYQIAIMIAIFSGTAVTVFLALWLSMKTCFNPFGVLDRRVLDDGRDR